MSGRHLLRSMLLACSILAGAITWAAPVSAQADTEAFDENETEGTIDSVRYQLWAIAGVTGALLVVYIWHTDPDRRQRVADRRQADREHADALALEDQFVLPADLDEHLDPG